VQIFAMCMECQKELGHPSFEPFFVPYYEDRIAYVESSRGHKSALLLQSQKFEVLLESGANALAAGFTLEAVASFSAALERFYEFCLKVISVRRKMSRSVYEQMFKDMAKQSERQLGAFLALHAVELGAAYSLNIKIVEFRNSVIHKGLIPNPNEAKGFCEKVYGEIFLLSQKLTENCADAINEVVAHDLEMRSALVPNGMPRATTTGTMFFSVARKENKATFTEAFDEYLKATRMIEGAVPYLEILGRCILGPRKA
jgi:hypothetical protein